MILFLDTSALVKLYIVENGSEVMHREAQHAEMVALAALPGPSFMLPSRGAPGWSRAMEPALDEARNALASQWPDFFVLEVSERIVELAGAHADLYALRAYDAVQLATADRLVAQGEKPVKFACFDRRLNKAAAALGMDCL